jgi:uncharacterized protein YprB with RNaseH-like and TPR domain
LKGGGDIRDRLARALERGALKPAGSKLGPAMKAKLDRALAGTPHGRPLEVGAPDPTGDGVPAAADPFQADFPPPKVYRANLLADVGAFSVHNRRRDGLTGRELSTPAGNVLQRRWRVPLEELASGEDLAGASEGAGVLAELMDSPELSGLDPRRALFLDTETTGLAGGTGTYVFLLGMGWVEKDAFVVEQIFLRDFGEEGALLHRARQLADRLGTLVTFNGRRYDIPLLDTRLVMNRQLDDLRERPHLDLLPLSRRLYGGRFEDCRLQTLEKELLGQHRFGDIPGAEIPGLYFRYLSEGDSEALVPVFEHNFLDVVTLLSMTAHFLHLCRQPARDPRVLGGLGRLLERRGNREQALELLEAAHAQRVATYRDLRELGFLYKRQGQHEKALKVWKMLVARQQRSERSLEFDATPFIEAAKYFEHRVGDFTRALGLTRSALGSLAPPPAEPGVVDSLRRRLEHRAARLERRLGGGETTPP